MTNIPCLPAGPGCIAWLIIAEIFPLHARESAMSVGMSINWIANWVSEGQPPTNPTDTLGIRRGPDPRCPGPMWLITWPRLTLTARSPVRVVLVLMRQAVAFSFPMLLSVAREWAFLLFISTTATFFFFTLCYVPETKNKTVPEITKIFR